MNTSTWDKLEEQARANGDDEIDLDTLDNQDLIDLLIELAGIYGHNNISSLLATAFGILPTIEHDIALEDLQAFIQVLREILMQRLSSHEKPTTEIDPD